LVLASQLAFALPTRAEVPQPTYAGLPGPPIAVRECGTPDKPAKCYLFTQAQMEEVGKQLVWLRVLLEDQQAERKAWQDQIDKIIEQKEKEKAVAVQYATERVMYDRDEYKKRYEAELAENFALKNPPFYKTAEFNRVVGFLFGILAVRISHSF